MRRNRVLIPLAVLLAAVTATIWLNSASAAATLPVNEGLTVSEGSSAAITNAMLRAEDNEDPLATLTFTLVSLPTNGSVNLDDSPLGLSATFTQADVDAGLLSYSNDGSESTSDNFDFTVSTSAGSTTVSQTTFAITVTPVNDPPVVSDTTFTVAENTPNGTLVGKLTAIDPEEMDGLTYDITGGDDTYFDIHPTSGEITVLDNSSLDFEALGATPHFTLTVEVSDQEDTSVAVISINVEDVNEAPTVNEATFSLMENSSVGTAVGTVTASDPEEGEVTFEIISGNINSAFAIGASTGEITVANSAQLNFEATPTFNLNVRGTDSGAPAQTHNAIITVNLTDKNEMPTINDATFSILENSSNGTVVGSVSASDPDAVDTLTFSITGGNTGSAFAINATTGQIVVNDSTKLNADTIPTHNLTVQVLDKGNLPDTATVTINLTPLPITHIYLPTIFNNYPPVEPNNHCGEAYALGSGITYEFTSDDTEDWYAYTLTSPGNLTVTLSSFEPAEGQLVVYGGICGNGLSPLKNNGNSLPTKVLNLNGLAAGTYYIRVYSKPPTNTTYNLRVN